MELEKLATGSFRFAKVDFADEEALEQAVSTEDFDRIVHLGAQAGVRYSIENPRAYARSNLIGHLNLLELARARGTKHFVYASSSSVYGSNETLPFRVEDRVDHPVSLYAATKKADELMSESYAHLYRLAQTGLRFFTVYGPWGRPDMAMWIFTRKILAGEPLPLFNHGKMRRDFTFIDDVVQGVLATLDSPPLDDGTMKPGGSGAPHAVYNIGNSHPEDLLFLISLLEKACSRSARTELLDMQPGDVEATYADIEPIRSALGFVPTTPLSDGVPKFVQWFMDHQAHA
jgi:UDP-glucuronate 4-epimerase